jgi:hypothetical protein
MRSGLLWYDGSLKKTVEQKITEAAEYFQKKYGRLPELCIVHPDFVKALERLPIVPPDHVIVLGKEIVVRSWKSIPTGHYWLGFDGPVEESPAVEAFTRHAQQVSA